LEILLVIVLVASGIGWIIKNFIIHFKPSDEVLSRKDYYNKIYLKSNAWKRKRYLVFKRDNWKCVYCGAKAQQVHHNRYAKINIGKEPIDWLESVCETCHKKIHN
jgi:5-methylcytosine-specific restriction endonuclease McrA